MTSRAVLKATAKKQLSKQVYWQFVIGFVIYAIICAIVGVLQGEFSLDIVNSLLTILLILPLNLGFFYAALKVSEGKFHICSFLYFISRGFMKYVKIIGLGIVLSIIVSVGFTLFIIPGIIWSLMFSQAVFIMAEKNCGILEALTESQKLMKGHKFEFFVFVWSFILWYLLIGITAGIASVFVLPYIITSYANYYSQLKYDYEYKNQKVYATITKDQ